jgi:hypothetical protein
MKMSLTQDRDNVSVEFTLEDSRGGYHATGVSGHVSFDGALTFTGTAPGQLFNVEVRSVLFEQPQQGEMSGTFEELYSSAATSRSGTWRVFARLRNMHRG